ncbi:MAG: hypothetical protein WC869_16590 [Phycisphaerae bacterium]|jgi:hypothetical protein
MRDEAVLTKLKDAQLLLTMDESDNEKAICICPWCRSPGMWADLTSAAFHCPKCGKQGNDLTPLAAKAQEVIDARH